MGTLERIGLVVESGWMAPNQARLVVRCPEAALAAQPGQFVAVDAVPSPEDDEPRADALRAPFLRRPISFCDVDRAAGTFTLAFRTSGAGTRALARLRPGDRLAFLGPLGHGFALPETGTVVAVGGGIGVYPLLHLLRCARERGLRTVAVCGYRSAAEAFLLDEFRSVADECLFASDAGGLDVHGTAADALAALWERTPPEGPTAVLACGPVPMLKAVAARSAAAGHPCQVSLEERMACGTGICLVCACRVRAASGGAEYRRCCTEGPVFDAGEVVWE